VCVCLRIEDRYLLGRTMRSIRRVIVIEMNRREENLIVEEIGTARPVYQL
jgi:hypothetical protein